MKLKKDITFIYMDKAEYQNYYPVYEEAKRRGYKVKMTDNKFEKCEIGFYCQHVNFPENSKFSVIMLHDIIQGYGGWPNLWKNESWDKYDIGVLPGRQWAENWKQSSCYPYAHPRMGVFEIGWPKADIINGTDFTDNGKELFEKLGLDHAKKTVLYAPAWENDNKQDDFVQSMLKLDVNIIIKQAPFNPQKFPEICKNIKEMYELHKDIKRVHIIDPNVNIMDAISICDILVSEESSTMCEATIMGKPAVSVVDWLIPDTTPSRLTCSMHPFTVKTKKADLGDTIAKVLKNYDEYAKVSRQYCLDNFSNIGETAVRIMDIIDSVVAEKQIPYKPIEPTQAIVNLTEEEKRERKVREFKLRVLEGYCFKYPIVGYMYKVYKKVMRK